jgi:hypothetical protein
MEKSPFMIVGPIFTAQRQPPKAGLKPEHRGRRMTR